VTKEEETERNKDEGSPYPCDYRCGLPSCILFPSYVVVSSLWTCLQKHRQQAADQMRLSASAVLLIEGARRDGLCSTKSLKSKLGNKSWSMLRSNDLVFVAAYLGWSKRSGAHISSIKGLPPAKFVLGLLRKVMLGSYVRTSFVTSKTPCTVREPRGLVTEKRKSEEHSGCVLLYRFSVQTGQPECSSETIFLACSQDSARSVQDGRGLPGGTCRPYLGHGLGRSRVCKWVKS
jgi:hypothetical protein